MDIKFYVVTVSFKSYDDNVEVVEPDRSVKESLEELITCYE